MIFKYYDFFIKSINASLGSDFSLFNLIIPIGISFYTFQQIAFCIDIFKSEELPEYTFIEYALHILFFGWITSGPIVKHSKIIPQLKNSALKQVDYGNLSKGSILFIHGLFKKVIIADTLGIIVNTAYGNLPNITSTTAIIFAVSYTLQIYFDFSGYSEMATGVAKFFNLEIPLNFNLPYQANSLIEFWKRWHISLTSFLTQYIYIPLGGNRKGKLLMYVNTMIVFLISGLWHGANITFIIWGALHGAFLCINKLAKKRTMQFHPALSWMLTFTIVTVLWIFFRCRSLEDAFLMIKQIMLFNFGPIESFVNKAIIFPEFSWALNKLGLSLVLSNPASFTMMVYILLFAYTLNEKNIILEVEDKTEKFFKPHKALFYGFLLLWCLINMSGVVSFIYESF